MKLSGDPSRYRQLKNGSWQYLQSKKIGWWADVVPSICPECGVEFVPAYRSKTQRPATCSKSCGVRLQWKKNPDKCKGENSGRWSGGRIVSESGYVMAWAPDHPDCVNNTRRYVPEHRLIMEKAIGRFLRKNETVHHINGDRQDNRPENLELWVKSQPAGQRARDLVSWAKEILALYGD